MQLSKYLVGQQYDADFISLMEELEGRYPAALFNMDGIGEQLDMSLFSKKFFDSAVVADASVDSNANVDNVSNITYTTELVKPWHRLNSYYMLYRTLRRLYGLQKASQIIEDQLTGSLYINDFHGIAAGTTYCFNYSTYDIMLFGLPMVKKIKSLPPKYLYSFKSQLEQFVVIASNSTLGATGLADLFIIMSYYVDKIFETGADGKFTFLDSIDVVNYIKETLVSFIYTINQPFRSGLQSPFVNVSVYDEYFLKELCDGYTFPDGTKPKVASVAWLQDLYLDVMNEEMERTPITFPVTTACFVKDEDGKIKDQVSLGNICEKNLQYGFINFYVGETSTLSSCCRLRSSTDNEYFNSFGAGSTKIGSLGVCTINLPKLAYMAGGDSGTFLNNLREAVSDCALINNAKRTIVKRRIEQGILPLHTLGFMNLSKQYSTCGINGLYEALIILGLNIMNEDGQEFVLQVMEVINETNDQHQEMFGAPHNCEQIPGENSSIKLASKDTLLGFNPLGCDYYSNQFIPLDVDCDLLDRIYLQGKFDKHFSGGAICHLNVEETIEDVEVLKSLVNAAANSGAIYFAVNYTLQECAKGHLGIGRDTVCSNCGSDIVNEFTRVVGFLTNTKHWHKVRREIEYPKRVWSHV